MDSQAYVSPREAADLIGIDPLRLIRLGRCLGMASVDRKIPAAMVERAMAEGTLENRYQALVRMLLGRDDETGASESVSVSSTMRASGCI